MDRVFVDALRFKASLEGCTGVTLDARAYLHDLVSHTADGVERRRLEGELALLTDEELAAVSD
jgi:hypothetical protein